MLRGVVLGPFSQCLSYVNFHIFVIGSAEAQASTATGPGAGSASDLLLGTPKVRCEAVPTVIPANHSQPLGKGSDS